MNPSEVLSVSDAERTRLSQAQSFGIEGATRIPDLIAMLTDPSWVVRRSVVNSLAQIGDAAVRPVAETLRTKRDNEARIAAAVDTLVATRGDVEAAIVVLTEDNDVAVIADGLQILGRRRSESAIPLLVRMTKHQDDIVAVNAIEALGRVGGRAAVEALIETTRSGNFFRTFPAIDILGRSGDRRAIEPLADLLANANYLPEAVRALGRSGDKAAINSLIELLRSPIDSVVRMAAVALWDLRVNYAEKSGDEVSVDDLFKAGINSEMVRRISRVSAKMDILESIAVCNLFGAVRNAEAASILTAKLDGPAAVAESAAAALKRIGRESDLHLMSAIRDGDSARRKILLPTVTRTSAAVDIAQCLQDADPDVRSLACETVARLGNTAVVPTVFKLLEDTNIRVVHAATAALQALGSRESRTLAVQASKSENPIVRRAAVRILAYFGDADSLQPILDAMKDEDPRVREVAIQGLPYLEDPIAFSALCAAAKSEDARTRALAVRTFAQVPKVDERIYSILLGALRDSDAWVRYYSCQSLGRLAYSQASQEIADLLGDEAGQVRVAAVEALSHLESRQAHRALQQAAKSNEPDVKRAALVGLGMSHWNEDLPIVIEALSSQDASTRLIALSSVVSFSSPLVLGALSSAASDSDEQVCSAAIAFLAARTEAEATEILTALLVSTVTRERAKTALQIPQLNRAGGILIALESASEELAPLLISILLKIPRPDAKRALLAAMKLNNTAARKAAAAGIAAAPDAERVAALKEAATDDPDPEVRSIASLLLNE